MGLPFEILCHSGGIQIALLSKHGKGSVQLYVENINN